MAVGVGGPVRALIKLRKRQRQRAAVSKLFAFWRCAVAMAIARNSSSAEAVFRRIAVQQKSRRG
jgi:hypothetical protein